MKYICNGQIIIVVGVKIETSFRIGFNHFAAKLVCFVRIKNSQRIGQHDTVDIEFQQFGNHKMNVIFRIAHTVRPVFEIYIHPDSKLISVINRLFYVFDMLLRSFSQLLGNVFV